MRALAAVAGALIALLVGAGVAHGCVCVRAHPATVLPDVDAAVVGVVETRDTLPRSDGARHVLRVERAVKGDLGERVTVLSRFTSCQARLEVGARVGLLLRADPSGAWTATTCDVIDPGVLIAAGNLPPPSGAAALVTAVDAPGLDTIALARSGTPAGYALGAGTPQAVATCGSIAATAVRSGAATAVWLRPLPGLEGYGGPELPLNRVAALRCDRNSRGVWAAGEQGGRTVVVAARSGAVKRLHRAPGRAAVVFAGSRAYVASRGRVDVVTLATGSVRTVRHAGTFTQLSVASGRLAGRLRGGRGAVLDLASGRLRSGRQVGGLVWLRRGELLDAANGTVLDARLAVARRLNGSLGRVVGVAAGTAYLASGKTLRRLPPGARRAQAIATLPGKVIAVATSTPTAFAAWHSCEKSAKAP